MNETQFTNLDSQEAIRLDDLIGDRKVKLKMYSCILYWVFIIDDIQNDINTGHLFESGC